MTLLSCGSPGAPAPWQPQTLENTVDGGTWVYIPGGSFEMGSPEGQGEVDERPRHTVKVAPFYLAMTPATNGQYAAFLSARRPSLEHIKSMVGLRGQLWRPTEIRDTGRRYRPSFGFEDHPAIAVTWLGADRYCRWAGGRLPTEEEWEYAARGGLKGARYPWGDDPPAGKAQFGKVWESGFSPAPTAAVGSFPANGYGLYDMAGNVWQWTSSRYLPYDASQARQSDQVKEHLRYVVRGGDFASSAEKLRVAYRMSYEPPTLTNFEGGLGLRCARDLNPSSGAEQLPTPGEGGPPPAAPGEPPAPVRGTPPPGPPPVPGTRAPHTDTPNRGGP